MDACLNWLWQGCAIAVATEILMRFARRASAATRYALWWLSLMLVLLLPALHRAAVVESMSSTFTDATLAQSAVVHSIDFLPATPIVRLPLSASWSTLIVGLWVAWAGIACLGLARAVRGLSLARRACVPFPQDREHSLPLWSNLRTRGRRAHLATCSRVRWAGVVGVRTPVIAVAPSLLHVLEDRELDQVIAHEWVHVQRRDDVLVLLQALVGVVAGFHPAVWWMCRQLDVERELACDELTVRVTGSVKDYARCLTKLAALPTSASVLRLAPAARSSTRLSTRIVALLGSRGYPSRSYSLLAFSVMAAMLLWLAPLTASVVLVSTREVGTSAVRLEDVHRAAGVQTPPSRQPVAALSTSEPVRPIDGVAQIDRSPRPSDRNEPPRAVASGARAPREVTAPPVSMLESASNHEVSPPDPRVDAPVETALTTLPGRSVAAPMFPTVQPATAPTPWRAAASSGVAVGRGSQKAAVATAGFFNKLGRKIADSF